MFDASATWGSGERITLRMGMDNLFDEDPVITGAHTALDPNPTTGQGTTEAGFYSVLGREPTSVSRRSSRPFVGA